MLDILKRIVIRGAYEGIRAISEDIQKEMNKIEEQSRDISNALKSEKIIVEVVTK
jgi:hypothetical protein